MTKVTEKVTNQVTASDDKDNVSVTYSADDPLFGDFAEKTEKGDEISVTVTKLSPISSPIKTTENEGLMKKGDKVTEISYFYTRENKNINIQRNMENPVTFRHQTSGAIKTHKLDENGNIVLED